MDTVPNRSFYILPSLINSSVFELFYDKFLSAVSELNGKQRKGECC